MQNLPLPCRPFPFDPRAHLLPEVSTRLPLSPYCNPLSAQLRQPRCFPPQRNSPLSLFCKDGFQRQFRKWLWPSVTFRQAPFSPHTHSRQATLHTAHDSAHCLAGSFPARTRRGLPTRSSHSSSHNTRSPRKPGRILHAIGVRPKSLTPSTHPKLGVKSRHQGLHRCALHRIFRPYLEEAVLTRILHRQNVYYHIIFEYSTPNF